MANVEFLTEKKTDRAVGVLKRLETVVGEVSALRDRLAKLQSRVEGLNEPVPMPNEIVPTGGLKGNLDRIESDLRGLSRTLNGLEELF